MNLLLIIIGVLLLAGCGVLFYISSISGARNILRNVLVGVLGAAFIVLSISFVIIPTGFTGVRTKFGQISDSIAQAGFNWKIPIIESIEKVNNKQQDIQFSNKIWSETSERTAIFFEGVTVTYQINADKSAWIYANVSDYKNNLVSIELVSSAIKSSSKILSTTDVTNRAIIEPLAQENIQNSLDDKYGKEVVFVTKVVINNIDFEDTYNEKIAEKQNAQLAYEQQQIENQKALEKAEADATIKITEAEAAAQAKLIAAQAEADANKLLSDSLSNDIFTQMLLEKWNGELPKVVGESNGILDITSMSGLSVVE